MQTSVRIKLEFQLLETEKDVRNFYDGRNSDGGHGPSNAMNRVALRQHSLFDIFFFIFPVSVFEKVR